MAMHNPVGRVNYEPNSWGDAGGPRENPEKGFVSASVPVQGEKLRTRSESFADHYSQARQFYLSQTEVEKEHIANALTFELGKCEREGIRKRMLSHLLNIHEVLAQKVACRLGVEELPQPADAAQKTRTDLAISDKLSILKNGPQSFKGRKLGVLVTDGVDAALLKAVREAVGAEKATLALVAPRVGGVKDSTGTRIKADFSVSGGPSVLYDAVLLLSSAEAAAKLAMDPCVRNFVSDAFAHCKYIGYLAAAEPLLKGAGISELLDGGCVALDGAKAVPKFLKKCHQVRFWEREAKLQQLC